MEDDGLILNFAPAGGEVKTNVYTKRASQGGLWRERRDARIQALVSKVNRIDIKDKRVPKRTDKPTEKRAEGKKRAHKAEAGHTESDASKRVRFAELLGDKGGKNNTYVSSLFTAKNTTTLQESPADDKVHKPSNAPLQDASTFHGLGLGEKLASHLHTQMKYVAPTKVQRQVLPAMLEMQRDLFVKAQTGSGKTLAFLLPILDILLREPITRQSGLFAIILTPTRELAAQIYAVLEDVLRCHHHIVPGIVVGGEKKKSEKARLRKGVNVLVATPGRLADHLANTLALGVGSVRWLVLDEGDRLVELGFQETITKITDHLDQHRTPEALASLPKRRINVLCSATMPDDVKVLGSTVLNDAQMISVADSEAFATAPDQLVQKVMVVPPKLRLVTLAATLRATTREDAVTRTMVFFSCSDSVDFHYNVFARGGKQLGGKEEKNAQQKAEKLSEQKEDKKAGRREGKRDDKRATKDDDKEQRNDSCVSTAPLIDSSTTVFRLHGSLSQLQRTQTLQQFTAESAGKKHFVLLCTDVASRGLDLPNIAQVLEYDPPFSVDDHLHRIGRSARVGNRGEATLFLLPGIEEGYVDGKLRVVHPKNIRVVNYESVLERSFKDTESQRKGMKPGNWDTHATTWHLDVERWLLEDKAALERALNAFISHVRAYTTHLSAERMYFNAKTLHLGHLAKAFALRETPKKLGRSSGQQEATKKEDPRKKLLRMARRAEKASEFNY